MSTDCEMPQTWKQATFFVDVVALDLNLPANAFTILELRISDGAAKTAGYMSLIHRATLQVKLTPDGEERTLSYVVKEKSEQVFGAGIVDLMQVFPKEIAVYEEFIPAFERFWERDGVKFGPRIFKSTTSPFTVIVMEDLAKKNFSMKDTSKGLSLEDCERIVEKFAQFHAASVVYFEQNGTYPSEFNEGLFNINLTEKCESYYAPLFDSYLEALEELKYPAHILDSIRPYKGQIYKNVSEQYRLDESNFNVLNHGDLWVNNILLNDNDVLLIDYQIAFYGSPSFDLICFIITSASSEVRTDKFDHLVEHYHRNLAKGLQCLQSKTPVPTLQALQADIRRHGLLCLALSMEAVIMGLIPDSNAELMCAETSEGVAYRRELYSVPRVIAMLEKVVPFMWEKGFLKDC